MDSSPRRARPTQKTRLPETTAGERLQKVLAAAGYGSRRSCEEYITTGRVTIDGKVADSLGVRVDVDTQKVAVDGERLKIHGKKYFLLHKPKGCLCTNSDPAGRTRVIDLLPPMEARLFSVGRLDENTEGLLLVTNDGELAHRLAHPRFQVERIYRVQVAGHPTGEVLQKLEDGLYFTEGKFKVRQAKKLKTQGHSTLLEIVITEGQNREVRRLFARIGHKVLTLQRVQFGPLRLADLGPAEYRPLRAQEIERLQELVTAPPPRRPSRRPKPTASTEATPEGERPRRSGPGEQNFGGPRQHGQRFAQREQGTRERRPGERPPRAFRADQSRDSQRPARDARPEGRDDFRDEHRGFGGQRSEGRPGARPAGQSRGSPAGRPDGRGGEFAEGRPERRPGSRPQTGSRSQSGGRPQNAGRPGSRPFGAGRDGEQSQSRGQSSQGTRFGRPVKKVAKKRPPRRP